MPKQVDTWATDKRTLNLRTTPTVVVVGEPDEWWWQQTFDIFDANRMAAFYWVRDTKEDEGGS